jgi:thiamine pyrophosphate-dependent acetolactate synthase large subunit-like protein
MNEEKLKRRRITCYNNGMWQVEKLVGERWVPYRYPVSLHNTGAYLLGMGLDGFTTESFEELQKAVEAATEEIKNFITVAERERA